MNKDKLLRAYPTRRIQPVDGMTVTAAVWEEAHDYHRLRQRFHALLQHGPGIVTGLEVIASDPPDATVYILPGIAMDPEGETIVLTEAITYDLGKGQGTLCLQLSHGESAPQAVKGRDEYNLFYIQSEFGVEARAPSVPGQPGAGVELARIRRQSRDAPVQNAADRDHPGVNEIDLRFRHEIGVTPPAQALIGVGYLGGAPSARYGRGVTALAQAIRRSGFCQVWVDDGIPLTTQLAPYTLIYLVGLGPFQLSVDEMKRLYTFVQEGGTLLLESSRRETLTGEPPAAAAFKELLESLGFSVTALPDDHRLLTTPYFFAAPPAGFDPHEPVAIQIGEGVLVSNGDYGELWGGGRRGGTPTRAEIQAAHEWGANFLAYALERRKPK